MLSPAASTTSTAGQRAGGTGGPGGPRQWLERWNALPREPRDTLFLLAVIAWVLAPHVPRLPWWCALLTVVVLVWRAWLALGSRPLPGKWWVAGLLAVTIAATLLTHRTLLGRDAGVTLIVVLLALKTLELRARRDAFVVFFLGFFAMLTNFFFSQSLLTAAGMLLALLGLLTALVNAHMPAGRPSLLVAARTAGTMALLGAPIMALLFVLFPRIAPLWGIPSDAMSGRSGLSSTMQVGTIASLALDESVAMRIRWEGEPPPASDLYFRGPVLATFDGREWRPLRSMFGGRAVPTLDLRTGGRGHRYEVTLEPHNRPWVYTLDATRARPELGGAELLMLPELQWVATRPVVDIVRYKVESHVDYSYGPRARTAELLDYLELPPGFNPRTLELAAQIRRDPRFARAGSAELVQEMMARLSNGGYTYTLEPGVFGQHTADEFWFDRKQGFCEHIASAFVILMRALDVPARVVTGYQGGERNPVDGFWTLRQSDAHAWTEVWHEGRGWVRVDPTGAVAPSRVAAFQRLRPPQGVLAGAITNMNPDLAARLRASWEAVNNAWNQWVLNYTQSKQLNLLKDIGFESPSWAHLSYVLIALVVAASALGALWTLWERSRQDPWLRLLGQARRRLKAAGIASHDATAPRELANTVQARFGSDGQAVARWLLAMEALRYARADRASSGLGALRREFSGLQWPQVKVSP